MCNDFIILGFCLYLTVHCEDAEEETWGEREEVMTCDQSPQGALTVLIMV